MGMNGKGFELQKYLSYTFLIIRHNVNIGKKNNKSPMRKNVQVWSESKQL